MNALNRKWWKEAVIYQIYPRSFYDSNGDGIGDIQGVIQKLDYLRLLGINVIWLSPIYKSPNDDNGYDISDYQAIMDEFGDMKDVENLIQEADKRDIKILMDLVVNHTSDEHEWFKQAISDKNSKYRDYYIWKDTSNNWKSFFGGSAWEWNEDSKQYYLHLFSKKQPDLNWENEELRKDIYNMMKFWIDKGIYGFRLDVCNFLSKNENYPDIIDSPNNIYINGPKIHTYLNEMNKEVLSKYDVMTVGEAPCVPPEEGHLYVGEDRAELNMIFQFDLMDMPNNPNDKFLKRKWTLVDLKRIFYSWYKDLKDNGWNSLYMNNHDQPRMVSRFGNDTKYRKQSAKMLATLIHTFQGTPYIYQGEEIGMTNIDFNNIQDYRDIETHNYYKEKLEEGIDEEELIDRIKLTSRDNARTPMQWDASTNAGFTKGKPWIGLNSNYREINVMNSLEDRDSIFYYYQMLIRIRKENPVIIYGDIKIIDFDNENVFCYIRSLEDKQILVVLNFTDKKIGFDVLSHLMDKNYSLLMCNYEGEINEESINDLRPYEARVYTV